jgi:hypothetical protein
VSRSTMAWACSLASTKHNATRFVIRMIFLMGFLWRV